MKHYILFINLLCKVISISSYKLLAHEPRNYSSLCGSMIFGKRPKAHTIILDSLWDNSTLNNCLSSLTVNYDRIILSPDYVPDTKTKNKLIYFTYYTPNIVIYTKNLNSIFGKSLSEILFQSHWSLVNIVVVDNVTYTCENGYFEKEVNASIHRFLNRLWHIYKIAYVVIEYPKDCPNKFSLFDGKKQPNNRGFVYDRTVKTVHANEVEETLRKSDRNLTHGYPLRANIFYRFPTSITECEDLRTFMTFNSNITNGYCGLDALVMHDVLEVLKFNTSFEMETIRNYGYVQSGHVTGALGLVVRGQIDVSFNSRFMVSYLLENRFNFLFYVWSDSLCALMKEPPVVPIWHYPFNIYDIPTWAFTVSCLTFAGSVMYVKSRMAKHNQLKLHVYVINAVWGGLFGFFFNKKIKKSLMAAACLMWSVNLTAKYQGHVNYMFATLVRYDRLNTLSDLRDNNIQMYTSPSIAILLGQGMFPNNAKSTLVEILRFYPENDSAASYTLNHPNSATIERSDLLLQTLFNLTDENGRPLLYAVNECFEHYYLSYIVRTGFLFTGQLQLLMMKIVEAGLPTVYYKWTRYTIKVVDPVTPSSEPRPTIKINLREQRVAFIILLSGYLISTTLFVIELWSNKRAKRANKDLRVDRYSYIE